MLAQLVLPPHAATRLRPPAWALSLATCLTSAFAWGLISARRMAAWRRPSACGSATSTKSLKVSWLHRWLLPVLSHPIRNRRRCLPQRCVQSVHLQAASCLRMRTGHTGVSSATPISPPTPSQLTISAVLSRLVFPCIYRPGGVPHLLLHHPAHLGPAAAPGLPHLPQALPRWLPLQVVQVQRQEQLPALPEP